MFPFPIMAPVESDQHFANVVSLLHLNGADGSTTITDVIPGKTWTASGSAQLDTAQSKFGGSSLSTGIAFDRISSADHADWDFGTGDFTVEFWVRHSSIAGFQTSIARGYTATGDFLLQTGSGNGKWIVYMSGSAVATESTGTINQDQWYHIAVTRSGTTVNIWRDGTSVASGTSAENLSTNTVMSVSGDAGHVYSLVGWMDEVRITKGIARYTANFTAPAAPFLDW